MSSETEPPATPSAAPSLPTPPPDDAPVPVPSAPKAAPRGQGSILRSASVMTVLTLISRILGLVREQVRALYLGTGAGSDAFGLASTLPNMFRRLFAEGAMTAAFVPELADHVNRSTPAETRRFLSRFATLLTLAVTVFTLLAIALTPWIIQLLFASKFGESPGKLGLTIELTELMWPYLILVTLAALVQGILNVHHIFGPSAFSPVLMNLAIILCSIVFASTFADPVYALVLGFLVGGLAQLAFQIPWIFRKTPLRFGIDFHFRDPAVIRILRTMIPGIFAAGIYQFNLVAAQIVAGGLAEGSIASLQYSLRIQEVVLGLFAVSVAQVILPRLSEHMSRDDRDGMKHTMSYANRLIAFVTVPCTVGIVILAPEIVRVLFQYGRFDAQSTEATAFALRFHALGLFFIGQARVLTQGFFALRDLKTATKISVVDMGINVVLCIVLSMWIQQGGIALASSLAAVANSVLLHRALSRRLGGLGLGDFVRYLGKLAVATGVMAGVIAAWMWCIPPAGLARWALAAWLAGGIGLACVAYFWTAHRMQVNEFAGLVAGLRRRFRRK